MAPDAAGAAGAHSAEAVQAALDKALAAVAQRQGFKKPKFHSEDATPPEGYTSLVHRFTITDEADPARPPLATIIKTSLDAWGALMQDMYDVEGHVYETVLPALEKAAGLQDPLPWPRCFYASKAEDGPPHAIALHNLQPEGFRLAGRSERLDAGHVGQALRSLARFHGAGLALQAQRPEAFRALAKPRVNPWGTDDLRDGCMSVFRAVRIVAPDLVKDKYPIGSPVNAALQKVFDVFEEDSVALFYTESDAGHTFVHADNHVNNLLFQYDKEGRPNHCCLIDFQIMVRGNPGIDVLLLLFACGDKAMRDAHMDGLLKDYHAELQAVLRAAGCADPDAVYSWQVFQRNLADAAPYCMCMTPFYHNGIYTGPEGMELCHKFFSDPESKHKVFPLERSAVLRSRLEGLFEDVVRLGWLPSVAEVERRADAYRALKKAGRHLM